jgi:two-component system NtrC family sensor kinase
MNQKYVKNGPSPVKVSLNLGIVGAGKTAKSFFENLRKTPLAHVDINLVGVCDINPEAEGILMAKQEGIYTTDDFLNIFKIKDLDIVIELTNSREVFLELIRLKPKGISVLDHNIGKILEGLFAIDQSLKAAEEQVVTERGASDFLIRQTNERIVVLNPDFRIVEANAAYLKAVAKPKDEVIGSHCYEVTHGLSTPCSSSQPEFGCPLVETLRSGDSAHVIHEHPTAYDQATYCDMVTYPLKDEDGAIKRVIEIWRDLTKELSTRWDRRVEAIKADLNKLVQEDRMISLGKLVASSVHEINNPIQGLLTFSHLMIDILEEGSPTPADLEKFKSYLALISSELERCGNIISGLLSFSRQSGMEYKDVDLNEILEQVIRLTRHKMEIQDIQLNTKLSSNPLIVNGDLNQLQQCFLNLIFNAVEAIPEGGQLGIVSELDRDHKNVCIEIRDSGCGIPEENLNRIFDPFFTTKKEGEGTGLGLSIVYGIVRNHGGGVRVDSKLGKGTTFALTFPIA